MIRKFLINKNLPSSKCVDTKYIEEAYMSFDPEVKVQMIKSPYKNKISCKYFIVIKEKQRVEIERGTYINLAGISKGRTLECISRKYEINDLNYILNTYKDLNIKTIEIDLKEETKDFILPEYFGEEITNDKSYNNINLAKL